MSESSGSLRSRTGSLLSDSGYPPSPTCDRIPTPGATFDGIYSDHMLQSLPFLGGHKNSVIRASPCGIQRRMWNTGPVQYGGSIPERPCSLPLGYGGWTPETPQGRPTTPATPQEENKRRKNQYDAYVAWVNSQLKKKPGVRLIEDLRCDMQDGLALVHLIDIVAGERLPDIYDSPSSATEMRENVDRVLHYMRARRIRMHHTTAQDIVEGNLKAIMRLILALAAHFKPNSVKQSHAYGSPRGHQTVSGIAQGAAAALADARRDAARASYRPRRPKQLAKEMRHNTSGSDSDRSRERVAHHSRQDIDGASSGGSPAQSYRGSPRSSGTGSPHTSRRLDFGHHLVPKSKSADFDYDQDREPPTPVGELSAAAWEELVEQHAELSEDLLGTKHTLLKLQDLLLCGQPPDGQEDDGSGAVGEREMIEGATAEETVVVLRCRVHQLEEVCRDLREEMSKVKNECMQLQGTKAGLQKRLADQEESYGNLKAQLLRVGFSQQSLETEKADLQKECADKDRAILELRRELTRRDQQIEEVTTDLQNQFQEKERATKNMKSQILDLHGKLKRVGETEADLSKKVASQDRKMARLEERLIYSQQDPHGRPMSARSSQSNGSDDYRVIQDSLQSLRTRFATSDPQHHVIDQLEQNIASLMDRLQMSEPPSHPHSQASNDGGRRLNYDSTGDVRRSPITSLPGYPAHRFEGAVNGQPGGSTKVLYFTDKTVTPFMCTIPMRLGEITLRDFRTFIDRPGNYRFHFKAMDPEFGTVKEEITNDDGIIPGYEGKIVAWVEEDQD